MRERFQDSLSRVLVHEGGYSNHPRDPGGVTLQGVIQRVYDADRRRRGLATRPLTKSMLRMAEWEQERDSIYRRQYWDVIKADQLPAGVDYVVFDGAVNSGPSQSAKWLQRALGVRADGAIGEVTLDAVKAHPDHDKLVAEICRRRMSFLRALKTFPIFGRGWTSRVNGVLKTGQAWATGSVGPQPVYVMGGEAKAEIEDAKAAPPRAPGDLAAGGGVVTGGFGTVLQQAQDALQPIAGLSEHIAMIVTVLVVAGAAIAVGGIAWRFYAQYRASRLRDALGLEAAA